MERRVTSQPFEVRSNTDGTIGVRGYAAVFNSEAHGEVIRSSAFNRTLGLLPDRKEKDDVKLLINHDGMPLARNLSGSLDLGVDDRGLWFDAPALDPANPRVQELVSAMSRGDIDQCSFAGFFREAPTNSGGLREVRDVQLVDVSIVTYPWYEETTVGLTGDRDLDRALVSMRALDPAKRETVLAQLEPTESKNDDDAQDEESEERDDAQTMTVEEARALLGI
jgi:HK97 family phage prohead protease